MLDNEFIANLPKEPLEAFQEVKELAEHSINLIKETKSISDSQHDDLLELVSLSRVLIESTGTGIAMPILDIDDNIGTNMNRISAYFLALSSEVRLHKNEFLLESSRRKFQMERGVSDYYEFSEQDRGRIQILLNTLREILTNSEVFAEDHRRRLLDRLEELQAEIHKKMHVLDKFWGFYIDGLTAAGRGLAKGAEEIMPYIREIAEIAWKLKRRTDALPPSSEMPLLDAPDQPEDQE